MNIKLIISVIIPVYNTSLYLAECIESMIAQTIFEKMEIILINDGSTDNSGEICEEYSNNYQNIRVIHQENKGVSVARNTGLKFVKGNYIYFCDSDDTVEHNLLEVLLNNIIENKADLSIVDFQRIFPNGSKKKYRKEHVILLDNKNDVLKSFLSSKIIGNNLVDKLFCYELIKNLEFSCDYKIGEDMFFIYNVLKKCNKVIVDSRNSYYNYIIRDDSAMNSKDIEKYEDAFALSKEIYIDLSNDTNLELFAYGHLAHEECKAIEYKIKNTQSISRKVYKEYKQRLKKYSLLKIIKSIKGRPLYGFILMRFSPKIYMFFHRILKIG